MDSTFRERGTYRFGPFLLDPTRRILLRDGAAIKIAERLFDTLHYLVVNQGRAVERNELLQAVWGGRIVDENNLSQAILALRKALQTGEADQRFIVTVPGRGYRFAAHAVFEPDPAPMAILPGAPSDVPEAPPATIPRRHRRFAAIAFCAVAAFLAAFGIARWHSQSPAPTITPAGEPAFAPPAHSIAILAFDNMSGDPGQAYFSDGLSEQLIDSLTRIDALEVAGRVSSFSFRGSHATVGEIGRKLNVSAVLQGSVSRVGNRVVVRAALTDTLSGFNIWSQTYDRDQADVTSVQTDIAQAVTNALQLRLLGDDAAKLTLGSTTNSAAYDLYLRATRDERNARNEADHRAALAKMDHVVALDPNFARAWAGRSNILSNIAMQGAVGSASAQHQLFVDALAAADRAIALAPGLSQTHSMRAWALNFGFQNHADAEREMVQAQMLTPGSATIEGNYANIEITMGHVDAALIAARRGTELDPLSVNAWGQFGRTLFMAHRFDDAVEALHHAAALTDKLPEGLTGLLGGVLIMQGHPDTARTLCAAGSSIEQIEVLAIAEHKLGHQAAAEAALAKLRADQGDAGAFSYAEIYAQWGRTQDALTWLDTAHRLHDPGALEAGIDPMLDPIRDEMGRRGGP